MWALEETRQTLSELKALVDSEKSELLFFSNGKKNSELKIFTSKHDPICKSKIPS